MTEAVWDGEVLGGFVSPEQARAAVALAERMSRISERCYAAGWEVGLEFVLWEAVTQGPRDWGRNRVTAEDTLRLSQLSQACGGWIRWSGHEAKDGARFIETEDWRRLVSQRTQSS